MADEDTTPNVRRMLNRLRKMWSLHSPVQPFHLEEEIAPGVTVSQFCTSFMLSQRSCSTSANSF